MDILDALKKHEGAVFEYGALDCFLFVADVVQDVTGTDYAKPWRGRYHSEFGALRMIAEHGDFKGGISAAFGDMQSILTVKAGYPVLIGPPLVEADSIGFGVGIYDGGSIVYLTETGLERAPALMGKGCWHV